MNYRLSANQALGIVLLAFLLGLLIRLPSLGRPISKHHDFTSAVILMNLESWRQGGGAANYYYTPLMNYQHPGDRKGEQGVHIDAHGNHVYLSLGPGWYILPYLFYQAFHLPADPLYLRLLNLLVHLCTLLLLFRFLASLRPQDPLRYTLAAAGCLLFLFTPGMLWYTGNGYVHTTLLLPMVILLLGVLLPMLASAEAITPKRLLLAGIYIIMLMYFDWLACLLAAVVIIACLARLGRSARYWLPIGVAGLATLLGILLIFWQFSAHAGVAATAGYWRLRFLDRSVNSGAAPLYLQLGYVVAHLLSVYLPLLLLLAASVAGVAFRKVRLSFTAAEKHFLLLYGATCLLYNLVLLNWSFEHEFAVMPWSIWLGWITARYAMAAFPARAGYAALASLLLLTGAQYFYINRPGRISRDGMAFDTFEVFGKALRGIPPDQTLFAWLDKGNPMIEYYAGRNITRVRNIDEARAYMLRWGITKAVWIETEGFTVRGIRPITASKE